MRAVRMDRFGEPADVLTVADVPVPQPGPGQILVRMRVRPINPSDLFQIRGRYGVQPKLPATPGMEGAGVVEALGDGVENVQLGQQVIPLAARGTWQEYIVEQASNVLALPAGLSDTQAAMLLVNPTSAWLLLHKEFGAQAGEWVLQNAANSAVGGYIRQLSRRYGYRAINVVRRRDVIDELRDDGAEHIICESDEDVVARVRELTGGKGVKHAIDTVGGSSGSQLAQCLAPGGVMIVFSNMSGQPLTLDPGAMLFRGTTVRGWWLSHWFRAATREQQAQLFATLIALVKDGTIHARVAAEYDLADVKQAIAAAESSDRHGKIVLIG